MRTCSVPNCPNPHEAKGFCKSHYMRWRRTGDPLPKIITTEEKFWLNVIKLNDCWLWLKPTTSGYGQIYVSEIMKQVPVHQYSLFLYTGDWPPEDKPYTLHSCHVTNCVNPEHLRYGTQKENIADMDKASRRNPYKKANFCLYIDCIEPVLASNLCKRHYYREYKRKKLGWKDTLL